MKSIVINVLLGIITVELCIIAGICIAFDFAEKKDLSIHQDKTSLITSLKNY